MRVVFEMPQYMNLPCPRTDTEAPGLRRASGAVTSLASANTSFAEKSDSLSLRESPHTAAQSASARSDAANTVHSTGSGTDTGGSSLMRVHSTSVCRTLTRLSAIKSATVSRHMR